MSAMKSIYRNLVCRWVGCHRLEPDASPAIQHMRKINDDLDTLIEEKYGRDFLENMIFARDRQMEARNERRNR